MTTSTSKSEIRTLYNNRKLQILLGEWVDVQEKLYEDISIYLEYNEYINTSKNCIVNVFMDGIKANTHESNFHYFDFINPLSDIYVNKGHSLKNVESIIVSEVDAVGN